MSHAASYTFPQNISENKSTFIKDEQMQSLIIRSMATFILSKYGAYHEYKSVYTVLGS